MFAIYSPEGRSFLGTLERLYMVHPISPVKARFKNLEEHGVSTRKGRGHVFSGDQKLERAERAYRDMLAVKNPRQPVTHAHQIMSHPVITTSPSQRSLVNGVGALKSMFNNKSQCFINRE